MREERDEARKVETPLSQIEEPVVKKKPRTERNESEIDTDSRGEASASTECTLRKLEEAEY